MSNYKTKMEVISGSPEMIRKIPQVLPGSLEISGLAPSSLPKKSKKGIGIAVLAAVVVVIGIGLFLALRSGLGDKIVTSLSGSKSESEVVSSDTDSQSGGGLGGLFGGDSPGLGGLFGGGSSGSGSGNALYLSSDASLDSRIAISGKDVYLGGSDVYQFSGDTATMVYRGENRRNEIEHMLCINGDIYYQHRFEDALMKVPGGDFSAQEVLAEIDQGQLFTDGNSLFSRFVSSEETTVYRIDITSGAAEKLENITEMIPVLAYGGKFYGKADGKWYTQDYDAADMSEFLPELVIEALTVGDSGMVALDENGGLYRVENETATLLLEAKTLQTATGEANAMPYYHCLSVDGSYAYFYADDIENPDVPEFYRLHLDTGVLQGIPLQGFDNTESFSVVDGWFSIRAGVFKLTDDAITDSMVYGTWHDDNGARQEGYEYQLQDISLINY